VSCSRPEEIYKDIVFDTPETTAKMLEIDDLEDEKEDALGGYSTPHNRKYSMAVFVPAPNKKGLSQYRMVANQKPKKDEDFLSDMSNLSLASIVRGGQSCC
jgi:hypothetical protein